MKRNKKTKQTRQSRAIKSCEALKFINIDEFRTVVTDQSR